MIRATDDAAAGGQAAPERAEIPAEYKWKLEKIFPDWDAWELSFAEIDAALAGLEALRGSVGESGAGLLAAIETIHAVGRRLEVVRVFASMKSDEDTRIGDNTGRRGRAGSLAVRFAESVSWFEPELLTIAPQQLENLQRQEEGLGLYAHFFDDLLRSRAHTLSSALEAMLAAAGNVTRGASQVYSALSDADLKFPNLRDAENREVELTKARYSRLIKSPDRRVRRDAFVAFHDSYGAVRNTMAATLDANVKNHVFYAEARDFPGTLEAALHPSAVPIEVYHTLIATVSDHLPTVHRYTALKQRVLGLDRLEEHDLQVPLFHEAEFKFTYEEAQQMLLAAIAPLGDQYVDIVRTGYAEGWIDVQENRGKRSGAYSSGVYDTQPYILLNWSDQLGDTFTLAHEMGHSVHSYLASANQPYVYGDYPIFTAEVASTCNEMLLMHHLLGQTKDRRRRLYLLDYYLSQINGTVFRQTMFAEFEYAIHRACEDRETLTADWLSAQYQQILARYWGPLVQWDPQRSGLSWTRIPHFYYNYYVYQYATAYAAAAALSRAVLGGDVAERERYLDVLRSGNSRYPVETLQLGGVDMTTDQPVNDVVALFAAQLDEVERLLAEE